MEACYALSLLRGVMLAGVAAADYVSTNVYYSSAVQRTLASENGIWGPTVFSFFVLKFANKKGTIQTMLPIVFIFEDI